MKLNGLRLVVGKEFPRVGLIVALQGEGLQPSIVQFSSAIEDNLPGAPWGCTRYLKRKVRKLAICNVAHETTQVMSRHCKVQSLRWPRNHHICTGNLLFIYRGNIADPCVDTNNFHFTVQQRLAQILEPIACSEILSLEVGIRFLSSNPFVQAPT